MVVWLNFEIIRRFQAMEHYISLILVFVLARIITSETNYTDAFSRKNDKIVRFGS